MQNEHKVSCLWQTANISIGLSLSIGHKIRAWVSGNCSSTSYKDKVPFSKYRLNSACAYVMRWNLGNDVVLSNCISYVSLPLSTLQCTVWTSATRAFNCWRHRHTHTPTHTHLISLIRLKANHLNYQLWLLSFRSFCHTGPNMNVSCNFVFFCKDTRSLFLELIMITIQKYYMNVNIPRIAFPFQPKKRAKWLLQTRQKS